MSMEQNEPQASQGQQGAPPVPVSASAEASTPTASQNGQQQRRRRRRRKTGKVASPPEAQAATQPVPVEAPAAEYSAPPPRQQGSYSHQDRDQNRDQRQASAPAQDTNRDQQRPRPAHSQQHHSKKQQRQAKGGGGGGSNQGRQFHKGGPPQPPRESNPGNGTGQQSASAHRKNKVRRAAPSFVGPMDHSYRAVNGNIADGSPSTMDFRSNTSNGNGNGNVHGRNGYQDAAEIAMPALLRDNAPVRIICFIEDLFVVAKLQETARKLGVKVSFAKAEKDTVTKLMETPEAERPSLIVFDLNNVNAKPLTLIPKLKAKLKRATSIIGFLSHIQGDLKLKAIEAGCDSVMPKAAFSQNLPNLLRRHGLEEELEAVEV